MATIIKILLVIIGVMLASFFAGAETGIYHVSRFNLRIGIEKKRPLYKMLGSLLGDTHGLMLSMLIGTNLAQYLVTSIVTIMFIHSVHWHQGAQLYATLVMTPVLFVFSELIPKNVFAYYADYLMPRFAPLLWAGHKFFTYTGSVPLLKFMASLISKATGTTPASQPAIIASQRHQISQIVSETIEEGILTPAQSKIIHRLINIPQIKVLEVFTPLSKVRSIAAGSDRRALLVKLSESDYTRFVVYQKKPDDIAGYINVYEVLDSQTDFDNIEQFIKPIIRIKEGLSVSEALGQMCSKNERIALVVSNKNPDRVMGIVTIKDLVEEFVGELTHI
ncbi:MAG: DUF21 domain-containing protein [Sedimentisphaerales bacterium]|nr:DUF21 domain-containing protein [Sedimentisphaerales bacterium]